MAMFWRGRSSSWCRVLRDFQYSKVKIWSYFIESNPWSKWENMKILIMKFCFNLCIILKIFYRTEPCIFNRNKNIIITNLEEMFFSPKNVAWNRFMYTWHPAYCTTFNPIMKFAFHIYKWTMYKYSTMFNIHEYSYQGKILELLNSCTLHTYVCTCSR